MRKGVKKILCLSDVTACTQKTICVGLTQKKGVKVGHFDLMKYSNSESRRPSSLCLSVPMLHEAEGSIPGTTIAVEQSMLH